MNLPEIKQKERQFGETISQWRGQQKALRKSLDSLKEKIAHGEAEKDLLTDCLSLLGKAASVSREHIKTKIENIVSHALQRILERDDYRFEIEFARKRGQIEAVPILHTATSCGNPLENHGGGVVDIITTTLRLVLKHQLEVPGPIVLDEPAKWLAESHRLHYMRMLQEFSQQTGTQIIMCSHIDEYIREAQRAIRVTQDGGVSSAQRIDQS